MVIALALLAALANALATVLERLGLEQAGTSGSSTRAMMAGALRRPIWYAGLALTTASFLLQALALAGGNLSTVQPIMVTEIVFLLAVLSVGFHFHLGWREWAGAGGTAVGLGGFLALSSSSGGGSSPSRQDWWLLLIASGGAIVLASSAGRRGPRAWRAACTGVAAAIAFALTAACIKAVAEQWGRGPGFVFTHFEAYGVAGAGLLGLVLSQHALNAGPVAASQSALLIVNPLSSIVMGIWLFDDHLQHGGARTALEVLALGVMVLGLFILSTSPLIDQSEAHERLSAPEHALGHAAAGGGA
ncbi:MAG TPA: DMT family transporter [Acidimicrobiales bacterium]|nr:DMT family transporter [Acidimicrobiales bacterium]